MTNFPPVLLSEVSLVSTQGFDHLRTYHNNTKQLEKNAGWGSRNDVDALAKELDINNRGALLSL